MIAAAVGCSYTPPFDAAPSDGVTADSAGDALPPEDSTEPDGAPPIAIVTAGLVQDLDADLGVTGTSDVTVWVNQITNQGEDRVVKPGGVGAIELVQNAINGHAALDFNNNARLEGDDTSAFADLTNQAGLTWFVVVEPAPTQDTNDRNQMFGWIRNQGINSGITAGVDRAARPYAMIRPASTEFKAQAEIGVTQWSIVAARLAEGVGANVQLFHNSGAPLAMIATTAANNPVGALTIGAERDDGTEFFDGRIARILIYARPLDDNELKQTGRALGQRYAITNSF